MTSLQRAHLEIVNAGAPPSVEMGDFVDATVQGRLMRLGATYFQIQ